MVGDVLPDEWEWTTLGEVADPGSRSIVSGPFGSNIGSRFFVDTGVPVIRGSNLTTDMTRFVDAGFVFVTENKAAELANCQAIASDLVFTAAGTLGQVGLIPTTSAHPRYIISNKQLRARLDPRRVNPLFAFYWFASPEMVRYVQQQNTGSTIPLINLTVLRSLPLPLPPLREQEAIASILGALDDKIELNRRMSETLEEMARALFKAWFVDGVMSDDSTGWADVRLKDVLTLNYGKGLRKVDRVAGDVPVYGSGGVFDYHNESLVDGPTIVVGRKGTVGSLYWVDGPSYPGDTVFFVESAYPLTYCFYLLETLGLGNMNTDAAVPGLNRENAYRLDVALPPENLLAAFDVVVSGFRERMRVGQHESQTLAQIRDTLLPKLISGELRVPDAERLVGEVA